MIDVSLFKKIVNNQGEKPLVSFSLGADSVSMVLAMKESGLFDIENGAYYYYYPFPLDEAIYLQEYLDYIENKLSINIVTFPSFNLTYNFPTGTMQDPAGLFALDEMLNSNMPFLRIEKEDMYNLMVESFDFGKQHFEAVGIKQGDSATRRVFLRNNQGLNKNKKKWYPIHNFENRDVINIIKRHDIKMPIDYDIFGISLEASDYRFSELARQNYPALFQVMKKYFPLLESTSHRVEKYMPENIEPKKGMFYGKFDCLQPSDLQSMPIINKVRHNNKTKKSFLDKHKQRLNFELQTAPYLLLQFKTVKEKYDFVKKQNIKILDDIFCHICDVEKYFRSKKDDYSFDLTIPKIQENVFEEKADNFSVFFDVKNKFYIEHKVEKNAFICVLFEKGNDVDVFVEKYNICTQYRDIVFM